MRKASFVPVAVLLGALFMLLPQRGPGRTIVMTDAHFSPAAVSISPGQALTFRNVSAHTQTATCVRCPVGLDTGDVQPGQVRTVTFTHPGTYVMVSRYAPARSSSPIRVQVGAPAASASASPTPQPAAT